MEVRADRPQSADRSDQMAKDQIEAGRSGLRGAELSLLSGPGALH